MDGANLIPKIGERIERLDTALFSGPASCWRYPSCVIRKLRMDRSGKSLWFRMTNIFMLEDPAIATTAFLFCYNKRYNYYVTVEGRATIVGHADQLQAADGWLDPILKAQRTYLIRLDVERSAAHFRHGFPVPDGTISATAQTPPPATGQSGLTPRPSHWPAGLLKKPPRLHWPSFGTR